MIREVHIRNVKTGNVRVVDYHVPHPKDPPAVQVMHDKQKPIPHVIFDIGDDEEVVETQDERKS
ncbi:MAG TPA: hypothetical protein VN325_23415 [Steroidobacteraceae bacterium]|nr:hypothetical protein [Steroidobacteraceae bacterium]